MTIHPVPITSSYWLPDRRLLAGEYPGHWDEYDARDRLRRFLEAGVSAFLDLTAPEDRLVPYDAWLEAEARSAGADWAYHRDTITDMGIPSVAQMSRILDRLGHWVEQGHTPYVHCWGGIGRTGTVVGCWLVRSGLSGDEALVTVQRLYETTGKHLWHPRSPQTVEQRRFVRSWARGDR